MLEDQIGDPLHLDQATSIDASSLKLLVPMPDVSIEKKIRFRYKVENMKDLFIFHGWVKGLATFHCEETSRYIERENLLLRGSIWTAGMKQS